MLTDAGQVLLEHAERLLNYRTQTVAALNDVRHLRRGQLIIASNELTCLYLLPVLHEYRERHAAVRLSMRRALASRIPADVRDYGAELGVVTYQPSDPDSNRSSCIATSSRSWCRRRIRSPSARSEHQRARRRAVRRASRDRRRIAPKVVETFRKRRVTLQMPVEMPTIDAIKKFVAMGNGVALLPAIAVESELARGELVRVLVPELAFERPVRLVYRSGGTLSHAAKAFLAVAEAHAATRRGRFAFLRE